MLGMLSGTSHAVALNLPLTIYSSVRVKRERRETEENIKCRVKAPLSFHYTAAD